jgi:SAM-dependent methyltransferase
MRLITQCLCGSRGFDIITRNGLAIATCVCGVQHLDTEISAADYEAQYRGAYHRAVDRHPGCIPYRERYEHDRKVAALRWARYKEILGRHLERVRCTLDVGAANGAFVDHMMSVGIVAHGIDPDPAMARAGVMNATAIDLEGAWHFDLVTYHDVLEHVLDPRTELMWASRLCWQHGLLVVDVPDVSVPEGEHHYKAEHPWYFTDEALGRLIVDAGFSLLAIDKPLPGKMVAYGARR